MRTFFFLIIFFFVELAVLIKVGGLIGVIPVIALLILSAITGFRLLGKRKFGQLLQARKNSFSTEKENPVQKGLDDMAIILCAMLLIIPGFITDIIGLCGMLPSVRKWLIGRFLKGFGVRTAGYDFDMGSHSNAAPGSNGKGNIIEGRFTRNDHSHEKNDKK